MIQFNSICFGLLIQISFGVTADDEELICDESAYVMLHQAHTGAPCLSFDVIQDNLGEIRESFPMTAYIVAGTQAAKAHVNRYIFL